MVVYTMSFDVSGYESSDFSDSLTAVSGNMFSQSHDWSPVPPGRDCLIQLNGELQNPLTVSEEITGYTVYSKVPLHLISVCGRISTTGILTDSEMDLFCRFRIDSSQF